jgi:dihydroneopterin aldolase
MTDTIFLRGLRADAVIGVHDWERGIRQTLLIDLDLATDVRAAAAQDRLADALDYDAVARRVTHLVEGSRYQLIESLAEAIVTLLQQDMGIPWLRLRLTKPGAVANAEAVGLEIERRVPAQKSERPPSTASTWPVT